LKNPLMFISLFALLLAAPVEAGSAPLKYISLQCEDTKTALAACKAVKEVLLKKPGALKVIMTNQDVDSDDFDLRITLKLTRQDADVLAGHLIWVTQDNQTFTGPDVEVSSSDAPLSINALNDWARGLLKISDLPISLK
jgi:hypothetical protein